MISYVTYKTLHFIGLAMVLLSLGALLSQPQTLSKRLLAMVHGIRTVAVEEEPGWAEIVGAWLREPPLREGRRAVAVTAARRAAAGRKSAYRAA